jgi:hypothetical protein
MANAIEQLKSGLVIGHAMLGRRGQQRGSVAQQVHDGDTVTAEAAGNVTVQVVAGVGSQGRLLNRSHSTARGLWPCLRAVAI